MAIAKMVAGGAAGGMEDDASVMSDERAAALKAEADAATREEITKLLAPAEKPKSKISDRQAAALKAQADSAMNEAVSNLRSAPQPEPKRGIARTVAKDNRFAPIAGSMGAGRFVREDGTMKGQGFFGPVANAYGTPATEISMSGGPPMSKPYTHRDDILYPTMVPGMTKAQLDSQLAGRDISPELDLYAWRHARDRLAQGKSPFAQVGEQYPFPGYEAQFMQQYPSAVMSYPNRTVGYQYYAGAPVTPYMSPVASRPAEQPQNMSTIARRVVKEK